MKPFDRCVNDLRTRLCAGILSMTLAFCLALPAVAQDAPGNPDEARLLALLDEFLAQASLDDREMHERFWAEDLIYTSSSGARFGKAAILSGLDAEPAEPDLATVRYWAEDQQVMVFGETAVVAFRLMAESRAEPGGEVETAQYFNTGTFRRRDDEWRAVAWQATRIPNGD